MQPEALENCFTRKTEKEIPSTFIMTIICSLGGRQWCYLVTLN